MSKIFDKIPILEIESEATAWSKQDSIELTVERGN